MDVDVDDVIPRVELKGSRIEKLRTVDDLMDRLEIIRAALDGTAVPRVPPSDLHGRYVNAPVWPWFAAGCAAGALFVLFFVVAWLWA